MLTTKRSLSLGILAGLSTLGLAVPAFAQSAQSTTAPTVILNTATTLAYQAPNAAKTIPRRRDGAGGMDTTINFDPQTGDIYSFFTMSVPWGSGSTNPNLNTGMQAALAYTKLTSTGLATPTVKPLTLQGQNGEQRVFMRPNTIVGKDFIAVIFADENNGRGNGNPQPVTWVYDRKTLTQLNVTNSGDAGQGPTDPVNLYTLSGDNDDQQLSPHSQCQLADEADGSQSYLIGLQYNNTQARVMKVNYKTDGAGGVVVTVPYETTVENTAQHTRPMFACPPPDGTSSGRIAGQYAVVTTVEADVRPANYGVRAILVDVTTGKKVSSTRVVNPDPTNSLWAVQPTAQYISSDIVALQYQMSNAPYDRHDQGGNVGDPDNHTGAPNLSYLTTLKVPAPGGDFTVIQTAPRVASYNRHAEAFGMMYGPDGSQVPGVGIISGSSTGLAQGLLQVIPIKSDGTFDAQPDPLKLYEVSKYSDVANLPAMSKRDADQARGFIHSYYGVPNPGYRNPNGFMPEVKTFSISAVAGYNNVTTDNRESVTFTLVPATWDPNFNTTPGGAVSNVPPGPSPVAPVSAPITNPTGPSSPVSNNPGTTGSGTGTGGVKTGYGSLGSASSGCGCTTAGSDQTSGLAGLGFLGLGFALLGLRRNKKES